MSGELFHPAVVWKRCHADTGARDRSCAGGKIIHMESPRQDGNVIEDIPRKQVQIQVRQVLRKARQNGRRELLRTAHLC